MALWINLKNNQMEKQLVVEKRFKALGTDIYFQLVCNESLKEAAEKDLVALRDFYLSAEHIFSRFEENSELNQLNNSLGKFSKASSHFLAVAKKILHYHDLSEGLFDPRVITILEQIGYAKDFGQVENLLSIREEKAIPKINAHRLEDDLVIWDEEISFNARMDFAGIAKGYITDNAGEMLKQFGWKNFLIDSGGDMLAWGKDKKGEDWKIDIEGIAEEKILLILKNEAVATSGIGKRKWQRGEKRFHHLVDPQAPESFSFDLQSVTVMARTVVEADFWAKVLFIKGRENGKKFALEHSLRAIFLDYRGNAWVSGEMKRNFYLV